MLSPDLIAIMSAINAGDNARARQLLQPLLRSSPSAEAWYQASRLTETPEHEVACLKQALGLDPYHVEARRRYRQLQDTAVPAAAPPPQPTVQPVQMTAKRARRPGRKRGTWFYVGVFATILLGLTCSYFVLLVIGSPIPGQLSGFVTGSPPVTEIDGVPLDQIPDAVFRIAPSRSTALPRAEAQADVLPPGVVHEYTFEAIGGTEVAIGIQFFSPTATRVSRNIAVLDPEGRDAESACARSSILQGDNGAAIICRIQRGGTWKVRLLGRVGESAGAYVVSIENLMADSFGGF